ncbi:SHOCT domain-containing protein [Anaerosporobacter sp.]
MKKFFGVALMFLSIIEFIGMMQFEDKSVSTIWFIIGFFMLGLYLYVTGKNKDGEEQVYSSESNNTNVDIIKSEFIATKTINKYFEIDEVNKKWITVSYVFGKRINSQIYDYSDIVQFELLENGNTVTKGGLGRALVGGAMFGGVGAVVGGATGKKRTKSHINSLRIKITTKDIDNPTIYINLINTDTKTDSIYYRSIYHSAQEILSLLSIMQEESKENNNVLTNNMIISSDADEILKLSELKDKGILTEEEFQIKKKQILNI